jgi:hypothetical protein
MPLDITEQAKEHCAYNAATASEFPYVGNERSHFQRIAFFSAVQDSLYHELALTDA